MQRQAANDAMGDSRAAKYRDGSDLAPWGAIGLTLLEVGVFENERSLAAKINSREVLSGMAFSSLLKKGYRHLATIIFPGSTSNWLGASPLFQQAVRAVRRDAIVRQKRRR
jgi:hypothetical protein